MSFDLTNNLVGYYSFEDSNGIAWSSIGTYHGTVHGTPIYQQLGKSGSCYQFTGDDGVYFPTEYFNFTNDFTISLWFKPTSMPSYCSPVSRYFSSPGYRSYLTQINGSTGTLGFWVWDPSGVAKGVLTPTGTISAGNWYHLVFVKSGSFMGIYVNGVLSNSISNAPIAINNFANSVLTTFIGCLAKSNTIPDQFVQGYIDEVAFWNIGLSSNDVSYLWNNGNGSFYISNPEPPSEIPNAPYIVSASAISSTEIRVSWTYNPFPVIESWDIEFNNDSYLPTEDWVSAGTSTVASFTHQSLLSNTVYWYRVRSVNQAGHSAWTYKGLPSVATFNDIPSAPVNLSANAVSDSQINLTWTDNSHNESGFKIQHFNGVDWEIIGNVSIGSYSHTGLNPLTNHRYKVCSYNVMGDSPYTPEVQATTLDLIPAVPTISSLTPDYTSVSVVLQRNSTNENGFYIEYTTNYGTNWNYGIDTPNLSSVINGLPSNTTIGFRARSHNELGSSNWSEVSYTTTLDYFPQAPTNLSASPVTYNSIHLTWVNNGYNIQYNRLYSSIDGSTWGIGTYIDPSVNQYDITCLYPKTKMYYRIGAYNQYAESYSNVIYVETPYFDLKGNLAGLYELEESSGTVFVSVPIPKVAYNGTVHGTPIRRQTGKIDYCYQFTGNNAINLDTSAYRFTGKFSVSMWINRTQTGAGVLFSRYYSSTGLRCYQMGFLSTNQLYISVYNSINTAYSCITVENDLIPLNNWYHVAFVNDDMLKIFVNGVKVKEAPGVAVVCDSTHSSLKTYIGCVAKSTSIPDVFFKGYIDEVGVWHGALSDAQVQYNYWYGQGMSYEWF